MLGITENRVKAPKEPFTLESQDDPVPTEPFVPSIEPGALPVDSPISLPQKRKSLADGGGKKKQKLDLPPRAPSACLAANVSQPVERSTKKGTKAPAVQVKPGWFLTNQNGKVVFDSAQADSVTSTSGALSLLSKKSSRRQ
ncbi:hypothetical protein NP233_g8260 [Leucocoprinus birnbaumii]|uniref:Uncharacterized protein n=1 Tax=Leucocoprinus birnbaumii TaxID=56174 RepID=A0AAD5YP83_9AGAR|nr:hypothetical protein NP233_g8260 [Leucocoprinus birnbaumii]